MPLRNPSPMSMTEHLEEISKHLEESATRALLMLSPRKLCRYEEGTAR